MKFGNRYDLEYNQIKTVLQPPPYRTNCKEYDINEHDHIRTHSDCVNQCFNRELNQKCSLNDSDANGVDNRTHCMLEYMNIWRQQLFEQAQSFGDMKLCHNTKLQDETNFFYHCITRLKESLHVECVERCQTDCQTWFYEYQVKKITSEWMPDLVTLFITHNHIPDQTIEYLPKMSFEEITGTVGGLMGMWLGLSILAIFNYTLKLN